MKSTVILGDQRMICVLYRGKIKVERLREEGRSGTVGQNRWTQECMCAVKVSKYCIQQHGKEREKAKRQKIYIYF